MTSYTHLHIGKIIVESFACFHLHKVQEESEQSFVVGRITVVISRLYKGNQNIVVSLLNKCNQPLKHKFRTAAQTIIQLLNNEGELKSCLFATLSV